MGSHTLKSVMQELENLGTAQNRKIYARHGAGDNMFGVSFGNLNKLAKRIRKDTALANQLWATLNYDAQSLATLIADPAELDKKTLVQWAKGTDFTAAADYFCTHVASKSPHAKSLAQKWMKSRSEYIGRCGYHTMSILAKSGDGFSDAELAEVLETIKAGIHKAPNRKREAMNNAVIAIGSRPSMKAKAIAAAKAIGAVDIDHGETSCKTPDAVEYIEKIHARNMK